MDYVNKAPFINRESEQKSLNNWIAEEPNHILFIYGPKSSGKTTLIKSFVENQLNNNHFEIKFFNLREILISQYKDFIKTFFGTDTKADKSDIVETREYNLKLFILKKEVLKGLKNKMLDPFSVMKVELEKSNKKGRRPVIIIDELQALEDIYINGQRLLINELFNFFVAMTKESRLCHILIASSDGYFVNKVYEDSKLKKTSGFFKVDYLSEEDINYWLDNLEKESAIKAYTLSASQKEAIWNMFGGSMWEITKFLGEILIYAKDGIVPDDAFAHMLEKKEIQMENYFSYYAGLSRKKQKFLCIISDKIESKGFFRLTSLMEILDSKIFPDEDSLRSELAYLVSKNFIEFDPVSGEYKMQGKSMERGLKRFAEMIQK